MKKKLTICLLAVLLMTAEVSGCGNMDGSAALSVEEQTKTDAGGIEQPKSQDREMQKLNTIVVAAPDM